MLSDYKIISTLYEGHSSIIYRAIDCKTKQALVIKLYRNSIENSPFKQEYLLLKRFNHDNIIRGYDFKCVQDQAILLLEDFNAVSVNQLFITQGLAHDLNLFLNMALQISSALAAIHAQNIIHKNIHPSHWLWNSQSQQLKLTGFRLASDIAHQAVTYQPISILEGELAYLAPEQTGRMNRMLDYRADFYALGVSFYQLLTGHLPFETKDDIELIHAHITKIPKAPHLLIPQIPEILSAIILKLMAKNAEDRYQTASGLIQDLNQCILQFHTTNIFPFFEIGQQDYLTHLQFSQKLYGRESELTMLLAAFDQASLGKSSLVLVGGYSGVGKTSLICELHKPIVQKHGFFLRGKFDQFQRNIPYSAIVNAFSILVKHLLSEPEQLLQSWRQKLIHYLGENAQLIIEIIPELELIIGVQPAVIHLTAIESEGRFKTVLKQFIRCFCTVEHPLVLFLDDLQWIDAASLGLLSIIMGDIPYLLILGAYRDNEVNSAHPLLITLEALQYRGVLLQTINLMPLNLNHIMEFVADTLRLPLSLTQQNLIQFAQLLEHKTNGNPFFLNQFLKTLVDEQLLYFDLEKHCWQWDIAQIQARNITNNVVELMVNKIQKLDITTQQALKLAASLGSQFKLSLFALISEQSIEQAQQQLQMTLQEGLLIKDQQYDYKFVHDRVQQAAYSLINETEHPQLHWNIAKALLLFPNAHKEYLFEIVDHLNIAIDCIQNSTDRKQLVELNLLAGQKARQSIAYLASLKYLEIAYHYLAIDAWDKDYQLTTDIYLHYAEAEFLNGHFHHAETLIHQLKLHLKTDLERASVLSLLVVQQTIEGKYLESIETARQALYLLGFALPTEKNIQTELAKALTEVNTELNNRDISLLKFAPENTHQRYRLAIKFYISLDPPTYILGDLNLYQYICAQAVLLSLRYGQIAESSKAYANYGLIIGSGLGDFKTGYQLGIAAIEVSKQFHSLRHECQANSLMGSWIHCWTQPIVEAKQYNLAGYQAGINSGELQFASYNIFGYLINLWVEGISLTELQTQTDKYLSFILSSKNDLTTDMILGLKFNVARLIEKTDPIYRYGQLVDENKFEHYCVNSPLSYCTYLTMKAQFLYLLNEAELANAILESITDIRGSIFGFATSFIYNFYQSLILLARQDIFEAEQQSIILNKVAINQQQLQQWAQSAPMNFQHKYDLIEAERAKIHQQFWTAAQYYEKALQGAKEQGFIAEQALICELTAKFYFAQGFDRIGKMYILESRRNYAEWGAEFKVQQLEETYPIFQWLADKKPVERNELLATAINVDMTSIIKAARVLSSETQLKQLLEAMLQIVMENSGADRILLFVCEANYAELEWQLQAEKDINRNLNASLLAQSVNFESEQNLYCNSLIRMTLRTHNACVIEEAELDERCVNSAYMLQRHPRSILSLPIERQGEIIGLLYCENHLLPAAFNLNRIETLRLLTAQFAIALENATLYQHLAEKVEKRTQDLKETLDNLKLAQNDLIQSEKMAALGQLIAGIAHEINTPIGAISSSINVIQQFLHQELFVILDLLEKISIEDRKFIQYLFNLPYNNENFLSSKEKWRIKRQLSVSLADQGIEQEDILADHLMDMQLYPHIDSLLPLLKQHGIHLLNSLYKLFMLRNSADNIDLAANKTGKIVFALKSYAHYQTDDQKIWAKIDIGLDTVLTLHQSFFKRGVELIKEYPTHIPEIHCYQDELNQCWVNLIQNALYAMNYKGLLTIQIKIDETWIQVNIIDTGQGIPVEFQEKIFQPFFTTKPIGEGSGIGLGIVKKIITKHGGQIKLHSQPGHTVFSIYLPIE